MEPLETAAGRRSPLGDPSQLHLENSRLQVDIFLPNKHLNPPNGGVSILQIGTHQCLHMCPFADQLGPDDSPEVSDMRNF